MFVWSISELKDCFDCLIVFSFNVIILYIVKQYFAAANVKEASNFRWNISYKVAQR